MDDDRLPNELARAPFSRARGVAALGAPALRRTRFTAVTRGAHWLADEEVGHHRLIQAYREVLPAGAVLGGWSAAWVHGVFWLEAEPGAAVEIVLPVRERVRPRSTLVVRGDTLPPGEVVGSWLGPATSSARTAFDLARRPDPRPSAVSRGARPTRSGGGDLVAEAVAAVDALLRKTGTPVDEVVELAARHPGARGLRRAAEVLALVDPRAESPKESELRVLLVRGGLPAPTPQVEVHDEAGRFVARLDLAWPELRVAIEYDGAHHRERGQHSRDLRRHNALRALGWRVMQVDAAQLADPERLLAEVARFLAAAGL